MIEKDKRPSTWPFLTRDLESAIDTWSEASAQESKPAPPAPAKKTPEDLERMLKELKALLDELSQ